MTINFDLLRKAAAIIEGIPNRNFNLNTVMSNHGSRKPEENFCGSIGCVIGWLAMHPEFKELGLELKEYDDRCSPGVTYKGDPVDYRRAASLVFGVSDTNARELFCGHGGSYFDPPRAFQISSKTIFRNRMVRFLKQAGQPISSAYRQNATRALNKAILRNA